MILGNFMNTEVSRFQAGLITVISGVVTLWQNEIVMQVLQV